MQPKYVFSMICSPEVEEPLLDALLVYFGHEVFMSTPVFSHGTDPRHMSAPERVMGRRRSVYVQALLTPDEAEELRRLLHKDFAGTGIRYWAAPVALEGEIA